MRDCIIAGGPNIWEQAAIVARTCDVVICADSGADFAIANGIPIDKVLGDFDSLSSEGKAYLDSSNISCEVYPCEKDETDTEICFNSLPKDDEIVLICSITGRIDHVMANINLAMKHHQMGRKVTLTDGQTDIIPMSGVEHVDISGIADPETIVISLVPLGEGRVEGVTTKGLYYSLDSAILEFGSTFSISNKLIEGESSFSISMTKGNILLVIGKNQ